MLEISLIVHCVAAGSMSDPGSSTATLFMLGFTRYSFDTFFLCVVVPVSPACTPSHISGFLVQPPPHLPSQFLSYRVIFSSESPTQNHLLFSHEWSHYIRFSRKSWLFITVRESHWYNNHIGNSNAVTSLNKDIDVSVRFSSRQFVISLRLLNNRMSK